MTHPDGARFDSVYDAADRLQYTNPTQAGGGSSWRMLTMAYDPLGRRTTTNPASSDIYYQYDAVSRLQTQTQHFAGSVGDGADTLTYNPASQITSEARSNNAFVYGGAVSVITPYTVNGLNQYTAAGSVSLAYDADGNLSSDGSTTYGYDAENRLISATGAKTATLSYDPLGRLWSTTGAQANSTTLFLNDGDQIALEMNGQGALLRRYMWGPGVDEPIVWDEGGALSCGAPGQGATTRVLHADHEGSVVAYADCWGNQIGVNSYDEHGTPAAANAGRFGYTGQAWIPELGLWYYKARLYNPALGRFMQVDPVGYKDQINLYEYVGDDPVDGRDPSGLCGAMWTPCGEINVEGVATTSSRFDSSSARATQDAGATRAASPNTRVGGTTVGALSKVLTNEVGSLSTPKGGDPKQLAEGQAAVANALINNVAKSRPNEVAPATGTASPRLSSVMENAYTNRANGGPDPVNGRTFYGTSHFSPDRLTSRPIGNGRQTVYEHYGPFTDSISIHQTYIYIYNDPGH